MHTGFTCLYTYTQVLANGTTLIDWGKPTFGLSGTEILRFATKCSAPVQMIKAVISILSSENMAKQNYRYWLEMLTSALAAGTSSPVCCVGRYVQHAYGTFYAYKSHDKQSSILKFATGFVQPMFWHTCKACTAAWLANLHRLHPGIAIGSRTFVIVVYCQAVRTPHKAPFSGPHMRIAMFLPPALPTPLQRMHHKPLQAPLTPAPA
jgi:hypothetical protein